MSIFHVWVATARLTYLTKKKTRNLILRSIFRKAVRAAIFLVPLMGISNLLHLVDCRNFNQAWKFAVWSYTSYFLSTFQGFFVAILYCFLNGEVSRPNINNYACCSVIYQQVRAAIKSSFYTHLSRWNHEYVPCRNSTTVSSVIDQPARSVHKVVYILCELYQVRMYYMLEEVGST